MANQQRTSQIWPEENLIIYLTVSDSSTQTSSPSSKKPLHPPAPPHPQPSEETLNYNRELARKRLWLKGCAESQRREIDVESWAARGMCSPSVRQREPCQPYMVIQY